MERVPDSKAFLTVDELNDNTYKLAKKYPDKVNVSVVGQSREGDDILCIKIGNGSKNALMFGCPHPNEPIGAMTLDFLASELSKNVEAFAELDYTWYIIKVIDPDATRLNEKWFKGPFTIYHYLRNYYRPAFSEQVEWTFPVKYKNLEFISPLPETQIIMRLIEELKPQFVYPLHNLGFGGAYWYISEDAPELYEKFYSCVKRLNIPRKLGEAEVPFATEYAPAVFKLLSVKDDYDYTEKYTGKNPAEGRTYGTSSGDYAAMHGAKDVVSFVCELPYFFEKRIDDLSASDMSRYDAVVKSCTYKQQHFKRLTDIHAKVGTLLDHRDNHFYTTYKERMSGGTVDLSAQVEWAKQNPEFQKPATVAQVFDNLYVSRFFKATDTAMLLRACEYELQNKEKRGYTTDQQALLQQALETCEASLKEECDYLEEQMDYEVTPIQKLVTVQAECGLYAAEYASKKNS